jgi:hypothetical protein
MQASSDYLVSWLAYSSILILSKRRLDFNRLHGDISKKIELFK